MVGILLFTNMALGIISRVSPQMNIFAIGFPITLVVGIVGIAVTLPMLDQPFTGFDGEGDRTFCIQLRPRRGRCEWHTR